MGFDCVRPCRQHGKSRWRDGVMEGWRIGVLRLDGVRLLAFARIPILELLELLNSFFHVSFLLKVSAITATAMTAPIMTCWIKGDTPIKLRPLFSTPIMSTPTILPPIPPIPPLRLAPPMTTAAIVSSSYPRPALGSEESRRLAWAIPAVPARVPAAT